MLTRSDILIIALGVLLGKTLILIIGALLGHSTRVVMMVENLEDDEEDE